MAMKKCPLGEECLPKINKLLDSCAETREYLRKCKTAGLDVDREIAANDEQESVAKSIKVQFFPHAK
jgi:hypothetical protein